MIIDKLVLHDFGVYGGYHEIDLAPKSPRAPLVLFGGLNGAGKTTLLDALQLSLYGQAAQCSNRNGRGYPEFLASCINKNARPKEALIGIDFRHRTNGKETSYSIRRGWRKSGKGTSEHFEAVVDGLFSNTVSKNWLHHVDEIMPANIANLFFFDGEQAEDYVVEGKASALIETAILNLLGLDIVHQLDKDLKALERRRAVQEIGSDKTTEVENHEKTIGCLREEIDRLHQKQAWLRTYEITPKESELAEIEERFMRAGGDLFERREEIKSTVDSITSDLADCEEELRKAADGPLPFGAVLGLLADMEERDKREQQAMQDRTAYENLVKAKEEILAQLRKKKVDEGFSDIVKTIMEEEILSKHKSAASIIENPMEEHARLDLRQLLAELRGNLMEETTRKISLRQSLKSKLDDATLEWAGIPKSSEVEAILKKRAEAEDDLAKCRKELEEISAEIATAEREVQAHESRLETLLLEAAEQNIKSEEQRRLLEHSAKARTTLDSFRRLVVAQHIVHIQSLVLENYQSLLRKKSLIAEVSINPESFDVQLKDNEGRPVAPERLSAGERQLFAISLLWGMAKASGRPLPTVIDTPLGRLDATHRDLMVKRYFPHASHQVLLFSTDQEVSGEHYESLKKSVGKSYRLEYDDKTSTTKILEGYLQ